ncbi:hypothetical protein KAJ89_04790 [Candidatus Parcubacteria bacterium]|nr:hypothetical protein [Candidatus Parcubacteria bacterium]
MQKKFETFLKDLFWLKWKNINWVREQREANNQKKLPGSDVLKKIIQNNLPNHNTAEHDTDDLAVSKWNKALNKARKDLEAHKTGPVFNFFNKEVNPYAHISKFLDERKEERIAVPWPAKLASVSAMALVVSIMIVNLAPVLANKIISVGDSIVVEPVISTTYLFGGESALARINVSDIPEAYKTPKAVEPINKNVLGSYIVNNHEQYPPDSSGEAMYIIPREELDGRVAGAWTTYNTFEVSDELTNISTNKNSGLENFKKTLKNILKATQEVQIRISKKLEAKLFND